MGSTKDKMSSEQVTLVTYNLDCREYNFEERIGAFLELIRQTLPDIVMVQEGTTLTYEKLMREMGLMGYNRNLLDIMRHRPSGEIIFSKHRIKSNKYIPFQNSSDNRGIAISEIDMRTRTFYVCTSQFGEKVPEMRRQIASFNRNLKDVEGVIIFGGDTRIKNYQKDLREPEGWYDGWYEAGSSSNEYTVDHKTNLMVEPPIADRPDRVWFRQGNQDHIQCEDYHLFGNESSITISSHYGVWATFSFVE